MGKRQYFRGKKTVFLVSLDVSARCKRDIRLCGNLLDGQECEQVFSTTISSSNHKYYPLNRDSIIVF
jgi:hypothetical protein